MEERYERAKKLNEKAFKRLVGVKKAIFDKIVILLDKAELLKEKKVKGGRPNKLSNPDKVFIALSYLREYRPHQMIAFDYGVSETTISRAIKEVEDIIVKSPDFRLPGKKVLKNIEYEFLIVDATEISIDRPKKNKKNITQENKKTIL